MQTVINIFNIKIHSIATNGSFTIGESLHNSPSAHTKSTGQNASFGDYAPPTAAMENVYIDPDITDQTDIGNPAPVNSNQL